MQEKQTRSYIFAALAILAWSSASTAFKLSLEHFTPIGLLCFSALIATLFLLIYNAIASPRAFCNLPANCLKSLPAGLLNPFLYYVLLFTAYSRLRAQEAQALNYTWAIVLSLFSVLLLKEKFRLKDLLMLLLSFFGVMIISTKGQLHKLQFDDALGTALALGSSVIWALYWIISLKDKRESTLKLQYNFLVGFILIMLYAILSRAPLLQAKAVLHQALFTGLWVGIFEMGLTFVLWLKALELTENTAKISNLIFVTPFLSLLLIRSVLGETIHPATIVGLSLIVASNLIQKSGFFTRKTKNSRRRSRRNQS
ncbi:MAG: DMT family transporter [Candidatus Cloacimonetes bacterium]|jgi:drug/metabolite transporter (DMT)-like permease|nr:DMT family transporter [Candidatus Cloacimonadota bacterium]MCB5286639.1 DMT family transporter [Candidatus Cloacimonadota bacterium]MCK9183825.1 DMT family transporter [Candidatus Cloacimonadota bacterium]MCK9584021.1 DMT family transporter [Candidatus Cloacimonadota bacterium]MDY0228959.1 DMT family transporter [Candidatus Cloacimonadaceae bacterium]